MLALDQPQLISIITSAFKQSASFYRLHATSIRLSIGSCLWKNSNQVSIPLRSAGVHKQYLRASFASQVLGFLGFAICQSLYLLAWN